MRHVQGDNAVYDSSITDHWLNMATSPQTAHILAEIGRLIRSRRAYLGWSQQALADRIGVHKTYISQIERGQANVHVTLLGELAVALDADVDTLLEPLIRSVNDRRP